MVQNNSNSACCSIKPVESDYKSQGSYTTLGGLKTYSVGCADAKKAIVCCYDIFGYYPQTEQGADILAKELGVRVVMPDFLEGKPWPNDNFPPKDDESKKKLDEWFGSVAAPGRVQPMVSKVAEELKANGVESLGMYGFCWGGKMTILAAHKGSPFAASAQVHPAMVDPADAENIDRPTAIFPSKDEPAEDVQKFVANLDKSAFADKCVHKTYDTMHHGWAAARADLNDAENKKQYEDVYGRLAAFFKANL